MTHTIRYGQYYFDEWDFEPRLSCIESFAKRNGFGAKVVAAYNGLAGVCISCSRKPTKAQRTIVGAYIAGITALD